VTEPAVVEILAEELGLDRFALLGSCDGGQITATWAARHPGRPDHGDLGGPSPRPADGPDRLRQLRPEFRPGSAGGAQSGAGPDPYPLGPGLTDARRHPASRRAPPDLTILSARVQRAGATAETAAALLEMFHRSDVTEVLPTIRSPSSVIHRRDCRAVPFS
jgi:pimeloyl-ACP methyl ester carboxylesterase